ncbi:nucleotidyl transferase AbiEii/AbiGii toxin family protein [Patescibacteria group bacterium]|nr:nucleotidyl transferase AbiEii/AbiGii toxin family protein [Patescibacteria group bacterium]
MHYEILDKKRKNILPKLATWKNEYVLVGGTALALQMNHRDSIDFDFFTKNDIDTQKLYEQIAQVFEGVRVEKIQEEENTLSVLIDNDIRLSFMTYPYAFLQEPEIDDYLSVASVEDIACMKLSAITGRSSNKDYIDLYYILHDIPLEDLLKSAEKKFPEFNENLVLKSLVYFDDIIDEPVKFQGGMEIDKNEMQDFLKKKVKEYSLERS